MAKFYLFSTEQGASLTPASLSPNPTTLIKWTKDPSLGGEGDYDPAYGDNQRGSSHKTLGGTVYQDFGTFDSDGVITMSDDTALSSSVKSALQTAYETQDGEFYFTDGYKCWKVRFQKPGGFKPRRDLSFSFFGIHRFHYDMVLLIVSDEI